MKKLFCAFIISIFTINCFAFDIVDNVDSTVQSLSCSIKGKNSGCALIAQGFLNSIDTKKIELVDFSTRQFSNIDFDHLSVYPGSVPGSLFEHMKGYHRFVVEIPATKKDFKAVVLECPIVVSQISSVENIATDFCSIYSTDETGKPKDCLSRDLDLFIGWGAL